MDQASQRGGSLGTLLMGLDVLAHILRLCRAIHRDASRRIGTARRNPTCPGDDDVRVGTRLTILPARPVPCIYAAAAEERRLAGSSKGRPRVHHRWPWSIKYLSAIDQVFAVERHSRANDSSLFGSSCLRLPACTCSAFFGWKASSSDEHLGVGRMLAGAAFLIFAISLLPGMFGSALGELDSFVPSRKRARSGRSGKGGLHG